MTFKQIKQTLLALLLTTSSLAAHAFEDFSKEAFDQALANNTPVLVDVYAPWCPTCKKQQKILTKYFEQHPDSELKVFTLDFDDQKQWVSYFKAPRQSTFIGYKNGEKVFFAVAETKQEKIFRALQSLEK